MLGSRLPRDMVQKELARLERNKAYKRLVRNLLISLVMSAAIMIVVTNLWLSVLKVNGSSMVPLLQMDEIVLVARRDNPDKNDVIAFYQNNRILIKRVIAKGGDKIDFDAGGNVSVNGEKLNEPYVTEHSRGDLDIELPFTVPAEFFFILGDNRGSSVDSRIKHFGTISKDQIIGKVMFIMWPLSRIGVVSSNE